MTTGLVPALAKKYVVEIKYYRELVVKVFLNAKNKKGIEKMLNFGLIKRHKWQEMFEYILIVALVVGIVFVAYKTFGKKVKEKFESATKTVQKADK
jgi:Flp pilus assembly pilin Flp